MRFVKALCCAAALTAAIAPGARADEWNKKTILTFSGPVQIPGATLPAGSYVFKLADIPGNRHVVQVFDKDEKKIYTTLLAVPNQRLEPADKPIVLFSERATGSAQAVKVWYYPGETIGNEFVYPKTQAMKIARESHTRVLATNDEPKANATNTAGEIPVEMKSAALGYFDENGTWQSDADKPVVTSNAPAQSARAESNSSGAASSPSASASSSPSASGSSSPSASGSSSRASSSRASSARTSSGSTASIAQSAGTSNSQSTGTSGNRPARKHLPRTSSSLALFELISGLSLAGGFAARQLRARLS
jgi:hypothetical protein